MSNDPSCHSNGHLSRRSWLHSMAWSSACWLTPLAETLGRVHLEDLHRDSRAARQIGRTLQPAKSLIVIWLQGGPSQLETFDPHPGSASAEGSKAIKTNVADMMFSEHLPQLADRADKLSIIRSVTSEEGDHERAIHNLMTGYRPEPTLVHPSLGSVICHSTESAADVLDLPRHVSILATGFSSRGGYLGPQYDAFRTFDPLNKVPDVQAPVDDQRFQRRLNWLSQVVEPEFQRGRLVNPQMAATEQTIQQATRMMSSQQLAAFDVTGVSQSRQQQYGDTAFGRGCIAATQLIEAGVRCVEVALPGWDTHANNHQFQQNNCAILDPAVATLLDDLAARDLLDSTMVLIAGEFGRTPKLNVAGGRDHWPHGFSVVMAGGGIQGGRIIGATDPAPPIEKEGSRAKLVDPQPVENIHATILHQMGIDYQEVIETPIGRPLKISEGKVIDALLG
jgi:hypothetical protein